MKQVYAGSGRVSGAMGASAGSGFRVPDDLDAVFFQ